MSDDDASVTLYWRPGCGFCMALGRQLAPLELPIEHRNIWDDPDAAEFVRTHANGNETVPTVAVGSVVMVNPTATQVLETMRTETPELVPAGAELPEPRGLFRRR